MIDTVQFAQKAFVVHENRLLIIRKSLKSPLYAGMWEVPGGRLEKKESLNSQLIREVYEETGVGVYPIEPFHLWDWYLHLNNTDDAVRVVAIAVYCQTSNNEISYDHQTTTDNIDKIIWADISDLEAYSFIPNMMPTIKRFIEKYRNEFLSGAIEAE